jgi:hypothetical protein
MSAADHLEMAKVVLSASQEAAHAVAAWGDYTAALMAATEAHMNALTEATALEEQELSYRSARCCDDDEGDSRGLQLSFLRASSSKMALRHTVAEAFRRKMAAESALTQAKSKAHAALDKAAGLVKQLENQ